MKRTKWAIPAAFGVFGAVVACSGNHSSAGGPYDACLSSQLGSACTACIQSSCPDALSTLESGCSDLFACICPGGDFSASNASSQTCLSLASESSCVTAQSKAGASSCTACDSACSASGSGGGNQGGSNGGDTTVVSGGSTCGSATVPPTTAVSLTLTGVDFGEPNSATEWQAVGWNLDGKCTTAASTDVCSLSTGAALQTQDDGTGGIDNSYGENVCPILEATAGGGACSTRITEVYLHVDTTGSGILAMPFGASGVLQYPVTNVHVQLTGSGGVAGGILPTASFIAAWQAAAGCISTSLCSASTFQAIADEFQGASDIGADGSNAAGSACDGISFGLRFTGSSELGTLPGPVDCACP